MSKNDTSHVSDNHGNNLMLLGASRGKLTIIQGALEHCNITDVHDKNDFGETALHLAAKHFYTSKLVSAGELMFFFPTGLRILLFATPLLHKCCIHTPARKWNFCNFYISSAVTCTRIEQRKHFEIINA